MLPINSVLIALNGQGKTRGTVAILRMQATCNQSLVSIKPDDSIIKTEFLFLYLSNIYQKIRNLTGDKERSGLNMPIIRAIEVPIAPIKIQEKLIAELEIERKIIEGNKQLIDTYTQKIQDRIGKIWLS